MTLQVQLLPFQQKASEELLPIILNRFSCLLIGATGTGKTYIAGSIIKNLESLVKDSTKPFPIVYLTSQVVINQTQQVLIGEFGTKKIFVTNYDTLRSTLGELFIKWIKLNPDLKPYTKEEIKDFKDIGTPDDAIEQLVKERKRLMDLTEPYWRPHLIPEIIFADECQKLRNENTLQTQIINQYLKQGGQIVLMSATPFTRVSEGKITSLALKPLYRTESGVWIELNENLWPSYARQITGNYCRPDEYNFEAVKRLRESLEKTGKLIRLKNVKFKSKCHTYCKLIDFQTKEEATEYQNEYIEYLKILAQANKDTPQGIAAIWVSMLKFRQAAERIKAPYLARLAFHHKEEKQVCIASNFIKTINIVKQELLNLGISPDEISTIVGDQSKEERQRNIDRFQTGKTNYCLFTLKSGGVGLSLDHNPKNEKICKPRYLILPPTWSIIELVQGAGRPHRIYTISDTIIDVIWFKDTIEEEVAIKVEPKLSCLSELVGKKESWTGLFSKKLELSDIEELKTMTTELVVDRDEDEIGEEFEGEAFSNEP